MKKAETAVEYEAFYTFSTKKRNMLKVAIDSKNHDLIRTLFTKKNVIYVESHGTASVALLHVV